MRQPLSILSALAIGAGMLIGQSSAGQAQVPAKAPQRDPGQSPASQRPTQTVAPQVYPAEQIQAGEARFSSQCGFCHGRDAAGGETGPDLTRSQLVANDNRGDKIGPLVRAGRQDKGMPAFSLNNDDMAAIVAFIHDQKAKAETLGGGRRSVDIEDLATGNAVAGKSYFNGAGGCSACHSAKHDLRGIASRYQGLALVRRMLYPSGQPAPSHPKVTVWLPSGKKITRTLASEDEFSIVVLERKGTRQKYEKSAVKYKVDDPMAAHFDQLAKYTDLDMHNVYAYLATLK